MSAARLGVVYLLCWAKTPYRHAGHYLGFAYPANSWGSLAEDALVADIVAAARPVRGGRLTPARLAGLGARIAGHRAGHGAKLTAAAVAAGAELQLVRIWPGTTEGHEKALKDLNSRRRLCPVCSPGNRAGVAPAAKRFRRRRPKPSPAMRKSPLSTPI